MSLLLKIDHYQPIQNALDKLSLTFKAEYFTPKKTVQPPMPLWAIYSSFDKAKIAPAEWGMLPNWDTKRRITRPLTVARVETLYERVSYKNLIPRYRALIPVNGFIVRSNSRTVSDIYKFYQVKNKSNSCMMLAALYQFNVDGNMQVVLMSRNEKASKARRSVRMPLLIDEENWGVWLNSEKKTRVKQLLEEPLRQDLLYMDF